MSKNIDMKLNPEPFKKIYSGKKIYELRLWDEKRRELLPGDTITFRRISETEAYIKVIIKALHVYQDFEMLFSELDSDIEKLGGGSPEGMYKYYSEEDIRKFGVVAIEFDIVEKYIADKND